jgi:acetolactate synthase-1/2/3 large subunit
MLVSDVIAKFLIKKNIKKVFLYPGGTVAPLINSLLKYEIEILNFKNEQGAGYGAIGASKISNSPNVVVVTSGPGVTNLITPIADSYFDSVPLIVFTGQVGTKDINFDGQIRQKGFQEIRTTEITKPITKFSQIANPETIEQTLDKAYNLAVTGRKGPVLIDLPMDVQKAEVKSSAKNLTEEKEVISVVQTEENVDKFLTALKQAKKPLILAGNGIYLSNSVFDFRDFADKYNLPVVSSLLALGVVPTDSKNFFGFVGHTGEFFANLALKYCDLLVVLGARLDVRQTGSEVEDFVKNKTIVRVDIDGGELNFGRIKGDINIRCNLKDFFTVLKNKNINLNNLSSWISQLENWKNKYDSNRFYKNLTPLSMYDMVCAVDKITKDKKLVVTTGVGTHQHIAARFFTYNFGKRLFFTSAGHGAMGYDIPTCIGAVSENKEFLGIVFVGDGSFQMNIQELATIKEQNLPVKIFVFDNKRLGLVSQFQKLNWQKDPTTGGMINPDFQLIGKGYGIDSYTISDKQEIDSVLVKVFENNNPVIVHCKVTEKEDVLPMLLGGQKLNIMYPFEKEV